MARQISGIAVLGSTGSIGRQTLDVIRALAGRFRVIGLAAGRNVDLLEQQLRAFRPAVYSHDGACERPLADTAGAAPATMEEIAAHPNVDLVMVATVGRAGLMSTLTALRHGKAVAIANKEVLVMAGHLVMREAAAHGGDVRPVDSEHSAVWQCLAGEDTREVARLILTASGGAFRDRPVEELAHVTAEEALRHPTWQMGRKVTIDSATLFNKGLETIEARWLFDVPLDRIEVLMHRESIVHSLVEFTDGSVKAQLGVPDMRLPIQYALTYPERPAGPAPRLDIAALGALHFGQPDLERYPCLRLAMEAGRKGGSYPAVLAAADEVAVDQFVAGRIGFMDIPHVIEDALSAHDPVGDPDLDQVLAADAWARERAEDWVKARV